MSVPNSLTIPLTHPSSLVTMSLFFKPRHTLMQPCKSVANYMTAFPIIPPQQYVLGCWAGYMLKKKKKNYCFYKFKQQKMKVSVRFLADEDT